MAGGTGINGTAITVTLAGSVLLYASVKGYSISKTVRGFLQGQAPSDAYKLSGGSGGGSSGGGGGGGDVPSGGGPGPNGGYFHALASFMHDDLGFTWAGTAGALGNINVETGGTFQPTAYNSGEGAIGFCQWEHGRRDGLRAFAAAHGSHETDPYMQMAWMRVELLSAFAPVYLAMRGARDPAHAAATWDAQYEISAGTTRQQRIDHAIQYFQTLTTVGA